MGIAVVSRRGFVRAVAASIIAALAMPLIVSITARKWVAAEPRQRVEDRGEVSIREDTVCLPFPRLRGEISLEEAMANRRSIRDYTSEPLTVEEFSQILWSAYGVTETRYGFKTTPSAGATYPLNIYAVVAPRGVATGSNGFLEPGSYYYDPHSHCARIVKRGDLVEELYEAGLRQPWIRKAPVNIVITATYERTTRVYGSRGIQYVHIEVGHAGQNIYLQATAMGLATVAIGAFYDDRVRRTIGAPSNERPLYIMPVGRPVKPYTLDPEALREYYNAHRGPIGHG